MQVEPTELPGVFIIEPRVFGDERGFFMETYHQQRYEAAGFPGEFVQDNYSRSVRGTLRGLHYQIQHPQGKLVQVTRGEIYDVAVDLRRNSSHFGRWIGANLSESNHRQLYVPPGFAHGFYVLSEIAEFAYKCTDLYDPDHERTLLWNDPELKIGWPLTGEPLLSGKDRQGTPFAEIECFDSIEPGVNTLRAKA